MKLNIKKIKSTDLKFNSDKAVVHEWTESGDYDSLPVNSQPTIIVVDSENNVIFGDAYAKIESCVEQEIEVVEVSDIEKIDLQKLCLTMHANGKWAHYDFSWMEQNIGEELPKWGWYEFSYPNIARLIEIENAARNREESTDLF